MTLVQKRAKKDRSIASANKRRIASKLLFSDLDYEDVHDYEDRDKYKYRPRKRRK